MLTAWCGVGYSKEACFWTRFRYIWLWQVLVTTTVLRVTATCTLEVAAVTVPVFANTSPTCLLSASEGCILSLTEGANPLCWCLPSFYRIRYRTEKKKKSAPSSFLIFSPFMSVVYRFIGSSLLAR